MKVFVERRKECTMKVPNVNEIGKYGGEVCAAEERMRRIERSNNRGKK